MEPSSPEILSKPPGSLASPKDSAISRGGFSPLKFLTRLALKASGWRIEGQAPKEAKYVLIAAPHTSNWDLVLMLMCGVQFGVWPSWVGKHTLFKPPFGWFMRVLGGLPIDRRSRNNMVQQLADLFEQSERLILAVPPEGTRGRREFWKSGLYFIAHQAQVPICLGYLDFSRKRGGMGPMIHTTGDVRADMAAIRAFYEDKHGRFRDKQGPVRLAAEEGAQTPEENPGDSNS
jgi:1-acyl-sn-glycerol-3-phosphate acyltransferase